MEPRIQYAQATDGASIAFYTLGEGMPFVMMPNIPFSHVQLEWQIPEFRRWHERLAEKRMLVRYDGRGHGLSDRDVNDYSLDAQILDLEAVAEGLAESRRMVLARRVQMADLSQFDWQKLGETNSGYKLVGRLWCCCDQHRRPVVIAVLKKGGSYRMLRRRSQGGWDRAEKVHESHAKYDQFHWKNEALNLWNDLSGHPVAIEMMPRPRGVRYH